MIKFHSGGKVLEDYIVVILLMLTTTDFGVDCMTNQTGFFRISFVDRGLTKLYRVLVMF